MTKQYYYYRADGGDNWHDQGTGPFADVKFDGTCGPVYNSSGVPVYLMWRDKPAPIRQCPECNGLREVMVDQDESDLCPLCVSINGAKPLWPEDKISLEELMDLFGGQLPIEAAALLFSAPDDKTVGEIRAEITAMAKTSAKYTADINNVDKGWVQVTISGPGADKLTEEQIEQALQYAGPMAMDSELGRLRNALRPFADYARVNKFDRLAADYPITTGSGVTVRAGDFKRASAVLTEASK